jgi:hypothetical protein
MGRESWHETARVHHASRRRGGVAADGPRAAGCNASGFLNWTSPDGYTERLRGFRQGLKDTGYVERENVAIEYRWAENQMDRLSELAAELVRRRVTVIAATGGKNCGVGVQGGNHDDPHRLQRRRRPGQA